MNLFQQTIKYFINALQFLLVIIYLLFEELIWDRLIVPIDRYIASLKILHTLEQKLLATNRHIVIVLFVVLFVVVEVVGIVAAGIAINGNLIGGMLLYLAKIPIAAFTFWMFGVVKDKLMEFAWFQVSYEWVNNAICWLKSTSSYKIIMARLHTIKTKIKSILVSIKGQLSDTNGSFFARVKAIYMVIKRKIKR